MTKAPIDKQRLVAYSRSSSGAPWDATFAKFALFRYPQNVTPPQASFRRKHMPCLSITSQCPISCLDVFHTPGPSTPMSVCTNIGEYPLPSGRNSTYGYYLVQTGFPTDNRPSVCGIMSILLPGKNILLICYHSLTNCSLMHDFQCCRAKLFTSNII
jgi:hypothetical protein